MLSGIPASEISSAFIRHMGIRARIGKWTFYPSSSVAMPGVQFSSRRGLQKDRYKTILPFAGREVQEESRLQDCRLLALSIERCIIYESL